MSKKFISALLDKKSKNTKTKEFVIPNILDDEVCFVGLKTGRKYSVGCVVYTGLDITLEMILEKIYEGNIKNVVTEVDKEILSKYLFEVQDFKISKAIEIVEKGGNFKLIKSDHSLDIKKPKIP